MERQHTENLFRRYKGKVLLIKTISGGVYKGHVGEITNDYLALTDREREGSTFILYNAIESVVEGEANSQT